MSDHDPLCRWPTVRIRVNGPVGGVEFNGCDCDLIARARADERDRIAQAIEAWPPSLSDLDFGPDAPHLVVAAIVQAAAARTARGQAP